jgi:hypothetical protein
MSARIRAARSWRARLADAAGKAWNAPNTALGLAYGALGMAVGALACALGRQAAAPRLCWRDNAFQFTRNPLGGLGAITLGNAVVWIGDPYDPADPAWRAPDGTPALENGHSYPEHERQHTIQGQQLGPLYLPSNLAGGVLSLILDRDGRGRPTWHGPHNWNERGPMANPPRPWAARGDCGEPVAGKARPRRAVDSGEEAN